MVRIIAAATTTRDLFLQCCFIGIVIVVCFNFHVSFIVVTIKHTTTTTTTTQQQNHHDLLYEKYSTRRQHHDHLRSRNTGLSTTPHSSTPTDDTSSITTVEAQASSPPPKLKLGPIFYNIYVPDDAGEANDRQQQQRQKQENAFRIIQEQMKQLREMSSDGDDNPDDSFIYYTLIGNITAVTTTTTATTTPATTTTTPPVVDGRNNNTTTSNNSIVAEVAVVTKQSLLDGSFCQPNCQLTKHIKQNGNEVDTLQALYEYCVEQQQDLLLQTDNVSSYYDDILVTYIHDKGSYHTTIHNEGIRRMATKAAYDCRYELLDNPTRGINDEIFNVCSGKFLILPQYLSSGNMWTTKCSYVKQLIPPVHYEKKLRQMYNETLLRKEWNPTIGEEYDDDKYKCLKPLSTNENHLGLGRYAYERWIWSHPHVVPAEVVPFGQNNLDFNQFPQTWYPRLGRGGKNKPTNVGFDTGYGISSYARLEGRLFEWKYLYNGLVPKPNSWIWSYYQNGYETGSEKHQMMYCQNNTATRKEERK